MNVWHDTLSLLAEISIAIIGFAAIAGIFARGQRIERGSETYLRLQWLLSYAVMCLGASLLPFLVIEWVPSERLMWQISCGTWLAASIIFNIAIREDIRQLAKQRSLITTIFGVGDILIALVLLISATGLIIEPSAKIYMLCLYYVLSGSISGFIYFIALLWRTYDDA